MRVFVTGASGWIGSAVVPELVAAGHQVTGLARSEASAERISAARAQPHPGSLDDLESIRSGAAAADAVIHLGFKHDFTDYAASGRTERAVVQTIGDELAGSGRGFLFASGVAATPGRVLTEEDPSPYTGPDAPRGGGEDGGGGAGARGAVGGGAGVTGALGFPAVTATLRSGRLRRRSVAGWGGAQRNPSAASPTSPAACSTAPGPAPAACRSPAAA